MKLSQRLACATSVMAALAGAAHAAGPDLRIGDLYDTALWGQVGDIVAYSLGTEVCNFGDDDAQWVAASNQHPVIAQNLYRHKDGRMEQIGLSWVKHGFFAVNGDGCGLGCEPPGFGSDALGVGCSDPYSANLNGDQDGFGIGGLGPRFEVNAATGVFAWPYTGQGLDGDAIYKRLQVHEDDVSPVLNPDATYFIEGQYVTQDEAEAGNGADNVSHREVRVTEDLSLSFEAPTVTGIGAIYAWQGIDPDVDLVKLDIPDDGRLTLASRTIDLGGGQWRYEYAIHNTNSHRSGQSFEVPVPVGATITNPRFHDVDYHSGEPYDLTDWPAVIGGSSIRWSTDDFATNPDANALRWGTMYNFGFDADAPPSTAAAAEIGLFRPGATDSIGAFATGPGNLDGPTLGRLGSCPGQIEVAADGLTPSGSVAFVRGSGPGTTVVPQGQCGGVDLEIADARLLRIVAADGSGVFSLERTIGGGLCGAFLQALDLTTCELSNVVQLP